MRFAYRMETVRLRSSRFSAFILEKVARKASRHLPNRSTAAAVGGGGRGTASRPPTCLDSVLAAGDGAAALASSLKARWRTTTGPVSVTPPALTAAAAAGIGGKGVKFHGGEL